MTSSSGGTRNGSVASFLRARETEILEDWEQRVRTLPSARQLDARTLRDRIPDMLRRVAVMAEQLHQGAEPDAPSSEDDAHARERLDKGFDLAEVVHEYALLRDCILQRVDEEVPQDEERGQMHLLHRAIDLAIAASVDRYIQVRDRTLAALDRIAAAALDSGSLDELLDRLVEVLVQAAPAFDACAVLIREGEVLRVRAAHGLEMDRGLTIPIGEGFAGRVAASRRPLTIRPPRVDAGGVSDIPRSLGLRVIYGVPLISAGAVLGVAYVGSTAALELSEPDERLVLALANRATSAILLHMLRERAERERAAAEQAMRSKEEVLRVVSHDLKSPLTAIGLSSAHALAALRRGDHEAARRAVTRIERGAERMENLVRDIVDASQVEGGGLRIEKAAHEVRDLVCEALEAVAPQADDRGVSLASEIRATGEIMCDRGRILQVLVNLLGNAARYAGGGRNVVLVVEDVPDGVRFEVRDDGVGIDEADLRHVFDRYWTGKKSGGTGLGLFVSKGFVEAHGGRIGAESARGRGARFFFTLPR